MNIQELIEAYQLELLKEEGCYVKNIYLSSFVQEDGSPFSSCMIGLYCKEPESKSYFHMLDHDEIWFYQGGGAIRLYLLYEDGRHESVVLGPNYQAGQVLQFVIPKGTYQAACIDGQESYSLFGCMVTPGFTMDCFHPGYKEDLKTKYPKATDWIEEFGMRK